MFPVSLDSTSADPAIGDPAGTNGRFPRAGWQSTYATGRAWKYPTCRTVALTRTNPSSSAHFGQGAIPVDCRLAESIRAVERLTDATWNKALDL
jgi:hypothetical protein